MIEKDKKYSRAQNSEISLMQYEEKKKNTLKYHVELIVSRKSICINPSIIIVTCSY